MRYWRLNSIQGLTMGLGSYAYPFADPEARDQYTSERDQLQVLKAREDKVVARYQRIVERAVNDDGLPLAARLDRIAQWLSRSPWSVRRVTAGTRAAIVELVESAMTTRREGIGGNDAAARAANRLLEPHQLAAMSVVRAFGAYAYEGPNPFVNERLGRVYDSERALVKGMAAIREKQNTTIGFVMTPIAKVAAAPQGSKAFTALLDYIEQSRIGGARLALRAHGIGDLTQAGAEMDAVAAKNAHCNSPGYHFVLAWPEGGQPSVEAVFALAERAIDKLGLAEHQHVVAIHDDAHVRHCHVAVNRVHPTTHKAVSVEWAGKVLREVSAESGSVKESAARHRLGVLRWTPQEALEQACAALPDSWFSDKYGIPREAINKLQGVVTDVKAGRFADDVLPALVQARDVLPKAWPEDPPLEVFEAVDRTIAESCRRRLAMYPDGLAIGERYDADPAFAEVVNRLVPGFEYPDWSHKTVKDVRAFAAEQARESTLRSLAALDVKLVESGRYIGKVVDANDGIVVQDAGRGAMVAHDARKFDVVLNVGEQVDVTYAGGRAQVVRQPEHALAAAGQER